MENNKKTHGFTLIEMMIVVAVIGILAAIAVQKYGDMVRKTREGNVKSSLGSIRSAVNIYYSDNEGIFPNGPTGEDQSTLADNLTPKYFKEIPDVYVFPYHAITNTVDNVPDTEFIAADASDDGGWVYVADRSSTQWGFVAVECYHTDMKGSVWTSY